MSIPSDLEEIKHELKDIGERLEWILEWFSQPNPSEQVVDEEKPYTKACRVGQIEEEDDANENGDNALIYPTH